MRPRIELVAMPSATAFAPLGVMGYCLTRSGFLAPVLEAVTVPLKTVRHRPDANVLDLLVSILAGCRAIVQVNTRLRPDLALAQAWGRPQFAAQATLARTLDRFTPAHVAALRQGTTALFRRESHTGRHPFAQAWLWLDIDLTPLPISKHAEGSTKGKIGLKKHVWPPTGAGACPAVSRDPALAGLSWQSGRPSRLWSGDCRHRHPVGVGCGRQGAHHFARGCGLWP